MSATAIIGLVDTILMLALEIPALFAKASALKLELQAMIAEGREPTDEEWALVSIMTTDMLDLLSVRAAAAQAHLDAQG